MADSFLAIVNTIINAASNNTALSEECDSKINHYLFYQLSLIPAFIICLSFALTKRRRKLLLSVLRGRPGLIFPMDTLTRSSRISFACAFGATTFLVYQIVLEGALAIDVQGSRAARSFLAIVSVFIYGMVFCPVFTCLAMGSVFGYGLGALYVWMLTGVQIYKLTECQSSAKGRAFLVLRSLPSLLCLVYLSVSIPARLLQSYRKGWILQWKYEADRFTDSLDVIRNHSTGQYVSKLFRKPKVKKSVEGSKLITVKAFLIRLVYRFLYHSKKGFRYPSRILSVMLVGTMVIYTIAFEVLVIAPALLDFCRHQPAVIRADPNATDTSGDFVCNISNVLRSESLQKTFAKFVFACYSTLKLLSYDRRFLLLCE